LFILFSYNFLNCYYVYSNKNVTIENINNNTAIFSEDVSADK